MKEEKQTNEKEGKRQKRKKKKHTNPNKANSKATKTPTDEGVRWAERVADARSQAGPFISVSVKIRPEVYKTMNLMPQNSISFARSFWEKETLRGSIWNPYKIKDYIKKCFAGSSPLTKGLLNRCVVRLNAPISPSFHPMHVSYFKHRVSPPGFSLYRF